MLFSKNLKLILLETFILLYLKDAYVTAKPTRNNGRCPFNESEWKEAADKMFCQGSDSYHCFLAEDGVSVKESCIEKTLILNGHCPFFTDEGYLHWAPCNGTACPNSSYRSDEVYKYRVCFGNTDSPMIKDSELSDDIDDSNASTYVIGVVVFLVVVVAVFLVIYFKSGLCNKHKQQDEDVENGVNVLKRLNILYVLGQLGNSVSTVGKRIADKYANTHTSKVRHLNYLDLDNKFSDNTVYFVDGWFGLWNDNPCERSLVEENLKSILREKNNYKNIKFVVGLRSEVEHLYKHVFGEYGVKFAPFETMRLDVSSKQREQEIKKHLVTVQQKCHDTDCECQALSADSLLLIDIIGTHLTLKLVDLDHSQAAAIVEENEGPVVAITAHFESLKSKDKDLFDCISYLVFNGFYDEQNLRDEIAEVTSTSKEKMRNRKLKKYTKTIRSEDRSQLATMWSSKMNNDVIETTTFTVFWHNFLYICAFHACYNSFPEKVMQYCNIDAILQLVRPVNHEPKSTYTVEADVNRISLFEKRIKGTNLESHVKDHPLLRYLEEYVEITN
ncbi:uncharacterized protein [Magallana gigas]|uniref:uncharacterized protein n=1 Tax=Magallana gigas TaxID=29159 RepID=UPI003341701E